MPKKVELLSCGREGLMVVSGCGEKIDSEDGQIIGFERGDFFFFFFLCIIEFYVLSSFREKKNQNFCFFFLNDADVENCGASKGFGYIYIYIYIYIKREREREREITQGDCL